MTKLPAVIDRPGAIFAYGFLLDHDNVHRLLQASRPSEDVAILEAASLAEAVRFRKKDSAAVVILRHVELAGVRVNVVTEALLHQAHEKKTGLPIAQYAALMRKQTGHDFLVPARDHQYLMVRVAEVGERPRFVIGGLVLFSAQDLPAVDADEYCIGDQGIYARKRTPELVIEGQCYTPRHVEFYAGNVGEFHSWMNPDDPRATRRIASTVFSYNRPGRACGQLPHSAYWPHTIRERK